MVVIIFSRQAIAKHIKILHECGMISVTPKGREQVCEVRLARLDEVSEWMAESSTQIKSVSNNMLISKNGYSEVNGIKMYYEIHGQGKPLILIHGGGSTIETTFGRVIPMLAKRYKVIAMDLQAHGRTR